MAFFLLLLTGIPPIPYNIFGDIMKRNCENCTRSKHRTDAEKKDLTRRLKIISGQIGGIQQMIDTDRYCDDVLFQIASATNALKSLGQEILKSHMKSCMVQDIKDDKLEVIDDIIDLFGKLK